MQKAVRVLFALVLSSANLLYAQSSGVQPGPVPGANSVSWNNDLRAYDFYHSRVLRYRYSVQYNSTSDGGRFSVLRAYDHHGRSFVPSLGGIVAMLGGSETGPWSGGVSFRPINHQILAGDTVFVRWAMYAHGDSCTYTYKLKIVGRTLVIRVEVDSSSPASSQGTQVALDRCEYAVDPAPIVVPYLSMFSILYANELFTSFFADWELTNASTLVPHTPKNQSATSAYYAHTITYNPKTNGKRNRLQETLYLTTGASLDDVLPNVPNPTSPYKDVCANQIIWFYGQPFAQLIRAPWRHLDSLWDVGVRNIWLQINDWQKARSYPSGYDRSALRSSCERSRGIWRHGNTGFDH